MKVSDLCSGQSDNNKSGGRRADLILERLDKNKSGQWVAHFEISGGGSCDFSVADSGIKREVLEEKRMKEGEPFIGVFDKGDNLVALQGFSYISLEPEREP